MAARAVLVAVIIRDAGLRSALTAQLALQGVDLLTGASLAAVARSKPGQPAILVVDERDAEDERELLETLRLERNWQRILVLAGDAPRRASGHAELIHVGTNSLRAAITQAIEELNEIEPIAPAHK